MIADRQTPITPAVIGFGGSALSGKSRLSQRVSDALGWPLASFGDYVRQRARERDLGSDRATLQSIGEDLINTNLDGFCHAVLSAAGWSPGRPAVLDGVRHALVATRLRDIAFPQPFALILVTATDPIRSKRLVERHLAEPSRIEASTIAEIDRHSTENDVRRVLPRVADLTVETSSDGDAQLDEVLRWLEQRLGDPWHL